MADKSKKLLLAAKQGNVQLVNTLIASKARVRFACLHSLQMHRAALSPQPDFKDAEGWNALHCAAAEGKASVLETLLDAKHGLEVQAHTRISHSSVRMHENENRNSPKLPPRTRARAPLLP